MSLSPSDIQYVKKRKRLTRSWPVAGGILLLFLAGLAGWLWLKVPYLINPWIVFDHLESGTLPESTTALMAAMLPILVLTLVVFAVGVVLLMFTAVANERRIIGLLEQLDTASNRGE